MVLIMEDVHIAHIREDGKIQSVFDHLTGTAKLASEFADSFSCKDFGYICGLAHDIGKYSKKFQDRIQGQPVTADHSTAGAIECNKKIKGYGILLSYCTAGHHTGLPDGGSKADTTDEPTLYGRLKRSNLPDYSNYKNYIDRNNITIPSHLPIKPVERIGFSLSFFIRMIFSCLVDADFLDTECFMSYNKVQRHIECSMDIMQDRLDQHIKGFDHPTSDINKKRNEILKCCLDNASKPKGIFTLAVPTGGGKTISSLSFALKHAQKHNMKRIIYVIPYTSIIEQNAGVFKSILGNEFVLEHHSNLTYDDQCEEMSKLRYATENWDVPIVVTTNVQFFESFYSSKSSRCRKLHNTANSVIIFDETQMLPTNYLLPCIRTIHELVKNYGSTCVLCSATQPALQNLFPKETVFHDIIGDTSTLYKSFKRTNIKYIGQLDNQKLVDYLNQQNQVLCIVNSRKLAKETYNNLDFNGSYHLSTLMCPVHRTKIIHEIKDRLKNNMPCRVISTSLIEAGVDIDFPIVYRQMAGLDSQIQAAGRCNREGKNPLEESNVYIFDVTDEHKKQQPAALKRPSEVARGIAKRFTDVSSPEAIKEYFLQLYQMEGSGLDFKDIVSKLESGATSGFSFPFSQIASEFKIIDDTTCSIIIPYDETAISLISRLKNTERSIGLIRSLQPYIVNIYKPQHNKLFGVGAIEPIDTELSILLNEEKYNDKTGLDVLVEDGVGIFF